MNPVARHRSLSIGEFAAATQLTPKALRLYDEQGLLRPASTDPVSGYRHYRSDQVATGRLIRILREMNLPLAQIAQVVAAQGMRAESLLQSLAQDIDRRYAKEKRAFQSALMLMRGPARSDAPTIEVVDRRASTVCVRAFTADRTTFVERFMAEAQAAREAALTCGAHPIGDACCSLFDPLADEEDRFELLLPIEVPDGAPPGLTIRHVPGLRYATLAQPTNAQPDDLTAGIDALFDWFDRQGHSAAAPPLVAFLESKSGLLAQISWAFESLPPSRS